MTPKRTQVIVVSAGVVAIAIALAGVIYVCWQNLPREEDNVAGMDRPGRGSKGPWIFSGKVINVLDGDTIEVSRDGRGRRIRLDGIDCPEMGQAFGDAARQFASSLAFGKEVKVRGIEHDQYGRIVAHVTLPDGRVLNDELAEAGLAWADLKDFGNAKVRRLEAEARATKRGLWVQEAPVPPWDFRHGHKANAKQALTRERRTVTVYITKSGEKYHRAGCSSLRRSKFAIPLEEAKARGYTPCARCKPPR